MRIWHEEEIWDRHLMLTALFSFVIVSLSLAVMFMLQAWQCRGTGRPALPDLEKAEPVSTPSPSAPRRKPV